jgi:hypothetical protein
MRSAWPAARGTRGCRSYSQRVRVLGAVGLVMLGDLHRAEPSVRPFAESLFEAGCGWGVAAPGSCGGVGDHAVRVGAGQQHSRFLEWLPHGRAHQRPRPTPTLELELTRQRQLRSPPQRWSWLGSDRCGPSPTPTLGLALQRPLRSVPDSNVGVALQRPLRFVSNSNVGVGVPAARPRSSPTSTLGLAWPRQVCSYPTPTLGLVSAAGWAQLTSTVSW